MSETVALGPWGRGEATSGGALGNTNPLQLMQGAMQLRQQQAEFSARRQFGSIRANSPDLETAMQRAQQDPQVAAFAPQLLSELRQLQLLQTQLQGAQLSNTGNAMGQLLQAMHMSMNDPAQLGANVQARFSTLPPEQQRATMPLAQSLMTSLLDGLPSDPAAARQEYQKRMLGVLVGSGMKPDEVYGGMGVIPPTLTELPTPSGATVKGIVGGLGGSGALGGAGGAPGSALGIGPTTTQQEYMTGRTKQMADYQSRLDEAVQMGATQMQTLQEARDLLQQANVGGGATVLTRLGQLAQAFGMSDDRIAKLTGGDLAARQEFEKLMVNTTMGQIRTQIPEGSRLNRQEFESFQRNNPNLDTDPRAVQKIFNFWTRLYVLNRMEQKEIGDYIQGGGDIKQWPGVWQGMAMKRGLLNPEFTGPKGSIPPAAVRDLIENPDQLQGPFDQKYGAGAAEKIISGKGG